MTPPSEEFIKQAAQIATALLGKGFRQYVEAIAAALEAAADKSRAEDQELLQSAHEALCKAGATALGVAMSGKNHPNPDKALMDVFDESSFVANAIGKRLAATMCREETTHV